ncbi:MAG: hypothetical protein GY871_04435 [Actinomycetales bacterium]|nr:hypothetical protein [Actinomycetales bacterium]
MPLPERHLLAVFELAGGARHGFSATIPLTATLPGESEPMSFSTGISVGDLPERVTATLGGSGGSSSPSFVLAHALVSDLWRQRDASPIQGATVTLWWLREGDALRPVDELYRGGVSSETWALDANPPSLSGSLGTPFRVDDVPFPPTSIGDPDRFPDAPEDSQSHAVPVIYGVAFGVPLRAVSDVTSGLAIELVIAGHEVGSPGVLVYQGELSLGTKIPQTARDGLGDIYSFVTVTQVQYNAGSNIYAESVLGKFSGEATKGTSRLGEAIFDLVRSYGRWRLTDFDQRRLRSELAKLDRFGVGFYADQNEGTLYDLLSSRLAGQFPFAVSAQGRFGIEPTLWPNWQDQEPVAKLIEGQNASREGDVSGSSADELVSEVFVDYRFNGYTGGTVLSDRFDGANDATARRAASRWEERFRSPISGRISAPDLAATTGLGTGVVEGSAYLIGVDYLNRFAGIRYRVEYSGIDSRFWELPLMSLVHLTDSRYSWTDEPMLLEAVRPVEDGTCDVVLVTAKAV